MFLDDPSLDPFEPVLNGVLNTAFTTGGDILRERGLSPRAVADPSLRRRFVRACHYGYDLAQREVCRRVIELERQTLATEEQMRKARARRDPAAHQLLDLTRLLRARQLALRRIIDAILFTTIQYKTWIIRRLMIEDKPRRIDCDVLGRTLEIAIERNREDRMNFNVISDLTTCIHVGDLCELTFSGPNKGWRIIELKEGRMNAVLEGFIEQSGGTLSDEELSRIEKSMGRHSGKQARRMIRQQQRLKGAENIIQTDSGIDPKLMRPMRMLPKPVETEGYFEAIREMCAICRKTGMSAAELGGCLHMFAMTETERQHQSVGSACHVFYHLANRGVECELREGGNAEAELAAIERGLTFADLVEHNTDSGWGMPIFLWGIPDQDRMDLVMGRITILIQFDINAFFKLAGSSGLRLSWITGAESEKLREMSHIIPGSPNARGVRVAFTDGHAHTLMSGFFARAVSDLTPPAQLVRMILELPKQLKSAHTRSGERDAP
jgi:hypothetical protein